MNSEEAMLTALGMAEAEIRAMSEINLGIGGKDEKKVAAALCKIADGLGRKYDRKCRRLAQWSSRQWT